MLLICVLRWTRDCRKDWKMMKEEWTKQKSKVNVERKWKNKKIRVFECITLANGMRKVSYLFIYLFISFIMFYMLVLLLIIIKRVMNFIAVFCSHFHFYLLFGSPTYKGNENMCAFELEFNFYFFITPNFAVW